MDKKTERMLDRIAIGSLSLRGGIEMQITDPLKGRPYYRMEDHNLILDGLYNYLQQLCIFALTSWDGNGLAGHPMTKHGSRSSQITYYQGLCGYNNSNYAVSGSDSLPPSDEYGGFLKNPVEGIFITDSTAAPNAGDVSIDGNVTALADFRTVVTSGSQYGTFTYTASRESFRDFYRRWDWTSANGNGTLSKIFLGMIGGRIPNMVRSLSEAWGPSNNPAISGRFAGQIGTTQFYITENNDGVVTILRLDFDVQTKQFSTRTYTVDFPALGATVKPVGTYLAVKATSNSDLVYVIPHTCNASSKGCIGILTLSTGACRVIDFTATSSYYNYIYYTTSSTDWQYRNVTFCATDGNDIYMIVYDNTALVRINPIAGETNASQVYRLRRDYGSTSESFFHGLTEDLGFNVGASESEFYYDVLGSDGSVQRLYLYQQYESYDYEPRYSTLKSACIYGSSIIWKGGNVFNALYPAGNYYYLVRCSSSGGQMDAILKPSVVYTDPAYSFGCQIMTAKLLPEPVVKNDMPMYIGYTLEFV